MKARKKRGLRLEALESRRLLAASIRCNFDMPTDVNADQRVSASDALAVINVLDEAASGEGEAINPSMFVDVNADGRVTAVDALQVVNDIATNSVESDATVGTAEDDEEETDDPDTQDEDSEDEETEDEETEDEDTEDEETEDEDTEDDETEDEETEDDADETDDDDIDGDMGDAENNGETDAGDNDSGQDTDVPGDQNGQSDPAAPEIEPVIVATETADGGSLQPVTAAAENEVGGAEAETGEQDTDGADETDDDEEDDEGEEDEIELEADLVGPNGETASVEFEMETEDGVVEFEFEVEVEGAIPDSLLDVLVEGILVGQVATDANGNGELEFSNELDEDSVPFPDGFPDIAEGTAVAVGPNLSGTLQIESDDDD